MRLRDSFKLGMNVGAFMCGYKLVTAVAVVGCKKLAEYLEKKTADSSEDDEK